MKSMPARIAAAFAALFAVGMLIGCGSSEGTHPSTDQSAEQADHNADDIAFARNMVPHHEQAVEMAQMVPTNTTNPQVIDLANQIIVTQVPEIQAFRVWLMQWQDTEGHHRGAIAMAQDEIAHGKGPDVIYLARSIIAAQQAEINLMKQMLGG
jgi:uncharacterized protein (DUF305 family)